MISGASDRDTRFGRSSLHVRLWGSVRALLCRCAVARARAVYRLSRAEHRSFGHAPFPGFCRSRFGFPRARNVLVRMDCFCRGLRSRDRPHCRPFARSPELVLGMVYVDHSPNGNGRMRPSHNTLVPTVAARVETPSSALSQMSALGHKRTFAAQNCMSAFPRTADMCSATTNVR